MNFDTDQKYTLEKSLSLFEQYLRVKLEDQNVLERFLKLLEAKNIGCFCDPNKKCHTDVILKLLDEKSKSVVTLPKRNCLKVKYLRPQYDNLKEWYETDGNVMCTRQGRVWITYKDGEKEIFHFSRSEWANPFKVK